MVLPPSGTAPVRAVAITMARDEGAMLARWVAHYGGQLGVERLIVLDDNSTDGSTDALPCTVHRLPVLPGGRDFGAVRTRLINGLAQGLLECYDVAIFTDVDEFLVPDPARYAGLADYLAATADRDVCAPVALNVVHDARVEGPLDPARPVLGQRQFAKFVPRMCKPSIKRVKAGWRAQGHGIAAPFTIDPDLFMIHLKFADRDELRAVADRRRAVFEADGRGPASSWTQPGDELAGQLAGYVGGGTPDRVPELDVSRLDLAGAVRHEDDTWSTIRQTQVKAMEVQPLLRLPERLFGTV